VQKRRPSLAHDELTTVRKNLETQAIEVNAEFVSAYIITVKLISINVKWFFGGFFENVFYRHVCFNSGSRLLFIMMMMSSCDWLQE